MKKILVDIDGSRTSINPLKYAIKIAKSTCAEILEVDVINKRCPPLTLPEMV
ncbi:MAG: hypothetical protein ACO2OY_04485 [Thermodesulfobacteriaceae bacterium]|jgi:nucleotide-binding universal stress UspA family protein